MPEGKQIQIAKGEYPELDGITDGRDIRFEGSVTIDWKGETGIITIQNMDFETENSADKAMGQMMGTNREEPQNEEDQGL